MEEGGLGRMDEGGEGGMCSNVGRGESKVLLE